MEHKTPQPKIHTRARYASHGRSLWDKFWKDKSGQVVITHVPNIWLVLWIVFELVSLFSASQKFAEITSWIASGALAIWALLEIFKGVNYFRRLLGLIILILIVLSLV